MRIWKKIPRNLRPNKSEMSRIKIGLALKPGDIIHACSGFNIEIASITDMFQNRNKHGWIRHDVNIISTDGSGHSWEHCCKPSISVEDIEKYFAGWDCDEAYSHYGADFSAGHLGKMVKFGKKICDERGVILPEVAKLRLVQFDQTSLEIDGSVSGKDLQDIL